LLTDEDQVPSKKIAKKAKKRTFLAKVWRVLKCSTLSTLTIIISIIVTISLLLFTNTGNQIIISVAMKFESRLTIELDEGSLFLSPTYPVIKWEDDTFLKIDLENVHYEFDWPSLPDLVKLKTLSSTKNIIVLYQQPKNIKDDRSDDNSDAFVLNIPIAVSVENIALQKIYFELENTIIIELDKIDIVAGGYKSDVELTSTLNKLIVRLPKKPEGETKAVTDNANQKDFKNKKTFPAILTDESLPEIILPLDLTANSLIINDFVLQQGKQSLFKFSTLTTDFSFKGSQLKVNNLNLNLKEADLKLVADINFVKDYPMNINVTADVKTIDQISPHKLLKGFHAELKGNGSLDSLKSILTVNQNESKQSLSANYVQKLICIVKTYLIALT